MKYLVQYTTTMYYEVEVEADSHDEARHIVSSEIGNHEPYDLHSEIVQTTEDTNE